MGTNGSVQGSAAVTNQAVKFIVMLSGGLLSRSVTFSATTVSVQLSPSRRSLTGSMVKIVGPPVSMNGTDPVLVQLNRNALALAVTSSLNLTVRLSVIGKSVAPFSG